MTTFGNPSAEELDLINTLIARLTSARASNLGLIDDIEDDTSDLISRLTAARASNLDYIDDIEDDTSLLVSRLTSARAGYLDRLNTGLTKVIKSIQQGSISASGATATATITSVNTSKAFVVFLGFSGGATSVGFPRIDLESSTSVRARRDNTSGSVVVNFVVVEFY